VQDHMTGYSSKRWILELQHIVMSCNSLSFGPKSHKEKAIVRIQLQDEEKQNRMENLTVVLFEDDTLNIRNGDNNILYVISCEHC
jgi:hypothetical protein